MINGLASFLASCNDQTEALGRRSDRTVTMRTQRSEAADACSSFGVNAANPYTPITISAMLHRRMIRLLLIVAAFAVVAMHIGMLDHSAHAMGGDDSFGPTMAQPTRNAIHPMSGDASTVGHMSLSQVRDGHGHRSHPMSTTSTICELLVLAAAVGLFPFVVTKWWGQRRMHVLPSSSTLLEQPRRGLRRSRSPDLTMLCVAIC